MLETISTHTEEGIPAVPALDFVWLELTNQCNLQCIHCYSESSPQSTAGDLLDESRYLALITEAFELGCRHIQFIGGEPTLNKSLPTLIAHAAGCGYQIVEVYTNLVNLSVSLLEVFRQHRVSVATSFYACDADVHDAITQSRGSHQRTVNNLKRMLECGLPVRVGVIAMEENQAEISSAMAFLRELGVTNIRVDRVRSFGRAKTGDTCSMESLCGNCSRNILAIGPDGVVSPCIMSKQWAVGSVLTSPLRQIAASNHLLQTRRQIADVTLARHSAQGMESVSNESIGWPGPPHPCPPDSSCTPNCLPSSNCSPCSPYSSQPCQPNRWCNPSQGR